MNGRELKISTWLKARYLRLAGIVITVLVIAALVSLKYWPWLMKPYLLILLTLVGTQFAAIYAGSVLDSHARRLNDQNYTDDIRQVIENRAKDQQTPAGRAVAGYLSQVTATYVIGVLTWGYSILISVRAFETGQIGLFAVPLVTLALSFLLLLHNMARGQVERDSITPYFQWKALIPPCVWLTFYRVAFLLLYSAGVITLQMPQQTLLQRNAGQIEEQIQALESTISNSLERIFRQLEQRKGQ